MTFRSATATDISFITETYNASIPGRMATADTEPVLEKIIESWIANQDKLRPIWIASAEDRDIGYILFKNFYGRPAYRGTAEISIYLSEDCRRKGYGRSILQYALDMAPSLEIHTLLAFIFSHNQPSMRLFKGCGFEEWGQLPQVALMDDRYYDLIILGKRTK